MDKNRTPLSISIIVHLVILVLVFFLSGSPNTIAGEKQIEIELQNEYEVKEVQQKEPVTEKKGGASGGGQSNKNPGNANTQVKKTKKRQVKSTIKSNNQSSQPLEKKQNYDPPVRIERYSPPASSGPLPDVNTLLEGENRYYKKSPQSPYQQSSGSQHTANNYRNGTANNSYGNQGPGHGVGGGSGNNSGANSGTGAGHGAGNGNYSVCPANMSYIPLGSQPFCIDKFEYPNIPNNTPSTAASGSSAQKLCEQQGKRLCTFSEWQIACSGVNRSAYPYGNSFISNRCNIESSSIVPSASFRMCVSDYHVYDQVGNLSEWVQSGGEFLIVGGAFNSSGSSGTCSATTGGSSASGFRCCK